MQAFLDGSADKKGASPGGKKIVSPDESAAQSGSGGKKDAPGEDGIAAKKYGFAGDSADPLNRGDPSNERVLVYSDGILREHMILSETRKYEFKELFLLKMTPENCTPKNDILVGIR